MINGGVPELKKQPGMNESNPQIQGTILFRENDLNQPQALSFLKSRRATRAQATGTRPVRRSLFQNLLLSDAST
jgi:hypothetical protein